MTIRAESDHPVHELIAARWSPYAFATRPVSKADLLSLFEAARWAPSSYNEQPWSYLLATREDPEAFARMLSCLVEGNRAWAKAAPVLALGCTRLAFARNGQPNAAALHDLGLASANLCLEATARGLAVHQMIGILPDRVRELVDGRGRPGAAASADGPPRRGSPATARPAREPGLPRGAARRRRRPSRTVVAAGPRCLRRGRRGPPCRPSWPPRRSASGGGPGTPRRVRRPRVGSRTPGRPRSW